MLLILDTTETSMLKIGLCRGLVCQSDTVKYELNSTRDLLPSIDNFLKNHEISLKDISAIAVNRGPGSYTSLRVGITTANTLAWSLNIPIIGFTDESPEQLDDIVSDLPSDNFTKAVIPVYPPLQNNI